MVYKPLNTTGQPILRHLPIESGGWAKLGIAAVANVAVAMQPRAHHESLWCLTVRDEGSKVIQG
ncbi:hypothetical protein D3C75_1162460 [compost metagenome]